VFLAVGDQHREHRDDGDVGHDVGRTQSSRVEKHEDVGRVKSRAQVG